MLLVDTSVWSLALRRKKAEVLSGEQMLAAALAQAIADARVAMIGPIRQELLSGVKEAAQFEKLRSNLEHFRDEALLTADYEEAARLSNLCRTHGQQCVPADILICAVAIRRDWTVLTADEDIKRSLRIISATKGKPTSHRRTT